MALKPTHGRVPLTGNYPPSPNRMWHVGPMARSVADVALGYAFLRGPDGKDGYATAAATAGPGYTRMPGRPLRVGWITHAVFGPIDPEVATAVRDVAALAGRLAHQVEEIRLEILERVDCTVVAGAFLAEAVPGLQAVASERESELSARGRVTTRRPAPSVETVVAAMQTTEQLRSAFAGFFASHDILLCPVIPLHRAASRSDKTRGRREDGRAGPDDAGHHTVQSDGPASARHAGRPDASSSKDNVAELVNSRYFADVVVLRHRHPCFYRERTSEVRRSFAIYSLTDASITWVSGVNQPDR